MSGKRDYLTVPAVVPGKMPLRRCHTVTVCEVCASKRSGLCRKIDVCLDTHVSETMYACLPKACVDSGHGALWLGWDAIPQAQPQIVMETKNPELCPFLAGLVKILRVCAACLQWFSRIHTGRERANPLMLLVCSVNTLIQDSRFHLPGCACASSLDGADFVHSWLQSHLVDRDHSTETLDPQPSHGKLSRSHSFRQKRRKLGQCSE